jgi:hypothetical protein
MAIEYSFEILTKRTAKEIAQMVAKARRFIC